MFFPAIKDILKKSKLCDDTILTLGGHRSFNFRSVKAPGTQNTVLRGQGTIDGRSSFSEDRYFTLTFMCNHETIKDALFLYYLSNVFGMVHIQNHEIFNRLIPDYVDFMKTDVFLNFVNPNDNSFVTKYENISESLEGVIKNCDNNLFAMIKKFSVKSIPEQTKSYYVEIDFLILYDSFDMVMNNKKFFDNYNEKIKAKEKEIKALYSRVTNKGSDFSDMTFTSVLKDLFPNAADNSDLQRKVDMVSKYTPNKVSIPEKYISSVEIVITNNIVELPLQGYKSTYQHMGRSDIGVTINLDFYRRMKEDIKNVAGSSDPMLEIVRKIKTMMRLNQKTYYVSANHWLFDYFDLNNFYLQAEGDTNFESDISQVSAISMYFLANSFDSDSMRFNATNSKSTMQAITEGDSSNDLNMFLFIHQLFYDFSSRSVDDKSKLKTLQNLADSFKTVSTEETTGTTSIDVISDYVYDLRFNSYPSDKNFDILSVRLNELVGTDSSKVAIGETNYMFQMIKILSFFRKMCKSDSSYASKVKHLFNSGDSKLMKIMSMLCCRFLGVQEIGVSEIKETTDLLKIKHYMAFVYTSYICKKILTAFACNENITVLDNGFSFEVTEGHFLEKIQVDGVLFEDYKKFKKKLKVSLADSFIGDSSSISIVNKQYDFFMNVLITPFDVNFPAFKYFFYNKYFSDLTSSYGASYSGNEIYTYLLSLAQSLKPYYLFFGVDGVYDLFVKNSTSDKAKNYLKKVNVKYLKVAFTGTTDLDLPSTDFDVLLESGGKTFPFWGSSSHPSDIILDSLGNSSFEVGFKEFTRVIQGTDVGDIFGSTNDELNKKTKETEKVLNRAGLSPVHTIDSNIVYPSDFSEKMKSLTDVMKNALVNFMPVFYLEFMNINNVLSSDTGQIFSTLDSVGYSNKIVDIVVSSDSVTKIKTARIVILDVENIVKYTNKGLERVISGETKDKKTKYQYNQKSFPIQQGARICLSSGSDRTSLKSIFNGYVETISVDTEKNHLILECCSYAKLMYSGEFNVAFGPGANGFFSNLFSVDAWNQGIYNSIQSQLYPEQFFNNLKSLIDSSVKLRKSVSEKLTFSNDELPTNKYFKVTLSGSNVIDPDKISFIYGKKTYTGQLDYLCAPDTSDSYYQISKDYLFGVLGGQTSKDFKITVRGSNSQGNPLITLAEGNSNVNVRLVRYGYAFSSTSSQEYENHEEYAKSKKLGMWSSSTAPVMSKTYSTNKYVVHDPKKGVQEYEVFDPNEAFISKTNITIEDLKNYDFQSSSYFILANILSQAADTYLRDMNQNGSAYTYVKPSKRSTVNKFNWLANHERTNASSGSILKNIYNVDFDYMHYGKVKIASTDKSSKYGVVSDDTKEAVLNTLGAIATGTLAFILSGGNAAVGLSVGAISLGDKSDGKLADGEYFNTSSYMNCLVETGGNLTKKDSDDLDGTSFSYTKKKSSIAEILNDMQSRYAGAVWDVLEDGKTATLFFGRKNYMTHRRTNPYASLSVSYSSMSKNISADLKNVGDLSKLDKLLSFLNNFSKKLVEQEKLVEIQDSTEKKNSINTVEPYANQIVAVSGVNLISAVIKTNFDVKNTAIVHYDSSFLGELFTDFYKNISQKFMNPLNDMGKISVPVLMNMPYEFYQPFVAPKTTKENVTSEAQAYETALRILEDELTNFYDGQIIITHNANVRVGTELTISDPYNGLFGTVVVKDYSHHISPTLGAVTIITPGLKHDYFDSFSALVDATTLMKASVSYLDNDTNYGNANVMSKVSRLIDVLAPSSYPITFSQGYERTKFYKEKGGKPFNYEKSILFPKERNLGISSTIYPIYSNDKLLTPFPETLLAYCAGMQYTNSVLGNFYNNIGENISNFTKKSLLVPPKNVFNWMSDLSTAIYDSFTTQTEFALALGEVDDGTGGTGGGGSNTPQNYFDRNASNDSQLYISPNNANIILDPGMHVAELIFAANSINSAPNASKVYPSNKLDSYLFSYLSELGGLFLQGGLATSLNTSGSVRSGLKGLFETTEIEKSLFSKTGSLKDLQRIIADGHSKGYVYAPFLNYIMAVAAEKTMTRTKYVNYIFLGSGSKQIIKESRAVDFETQRILSANSVYKDPTKSIYITMRSPHKGHNYGIGSFAKDTHLWFLYDPSNPVNKSQAESCVSSVNSTMANFYKVKGFSTAEPYTKYFKAGSIPAFNQKYKATILCMVNSSNTSEGIKLTLRKDFRETLFMSIVNTVTGSSGTLAQTKTGLIESLEKFKIKIGSSYYKPYSVFETTTEGDRYVYSRIRALDICMNRGLTSHQNTAKSCLEALLPPTHIYRETLNPERSKYTASEYSKENTIKLSQLSMKTKVYHNNVLVKNPVGIMKDSTSVKNSFRKHQTLFMNMEQCSFYSNSFHTQFNKKYNNLERDMFDSFVTKLTAIGTAAYTSKLSAFTEVFYVFPQGKGNGNEKNDFISFIKQYLVAYIKQCQIVDGRKDEFMNLGSIKVEEVRRYDYKNSLLGTMVTSVEFMIIIINVNEEINSNSGVSFSNVPLTGYKATTDSKGNVVYVSSAGKKSSGIVVSFDKKVLSKKTSLKTLALPITYTGNTPQAIVKDNPTNSYFFIHAFDVSDGDGDYASNAPLKHAFSNMNMQAPNISVPYVYLLGDFNFNLTNNSYSSGNSKNDISKIEIKLGGVTTPFEERKGFNPMSNFYAEKVTVSQNDHIFFNHENPLGNKSDVNVYNVVHDHLSQRVFNSSNPYKLGSDGYYLAQLLGLSVSNPFIVSNHPTIYISY